MNRYTKQSAIDNMTGGRAFSNISPKKADTRSFPDYDFKKKRSDSIPILSRYGDKYDGLSTKKKLDSESDEEKVIIKKPLSYKSKKVLSDDDYDKSKSKVDEIDFTDLDIEMDDYIASTNKTIMKSKTEKPKLAYKPKEQKYTVILFYGYDVLSNSDGYINASLDDFVRDKITVDSWLELANTQKILEFVSSKVHVSFDLLVKKVPHIPGSITQFMGTYLHPKVMFYYLTYISPEFTWNLENDKPKESNNLESKLDTIIKQNKKMLSCHKNMHSLVDNINTTSENILDVVYVIDSKLEKKPKKKIEKKEKSKSYRFIIIKNFETKYKYDYTVISAKHKKVYDIQDKHLTKFPNGDTIVEFNTNCPNLWEKLRDNHLYDEMFDNVDGYNFNLSDEYSEEDMINTIEELAQDY